MRAAEISSAQSLTLVHLRVTPGAVGLVMVKTGIGPAPNSDSRTDLVAAEVMQCAQGYSGWRGVSMVGSQSGTRVVASLPSISPLRIAVIGRQNWNAYLASKTAMYASAVARSTSANKRAFWS